MAANIFKIVVVIYYYKMKEEVLERLGLSPNEIRVYLSLLELGLSNASSIVKKTGLHRPNVYYSINRLQERGLIASCIRQNVNYYQAGNPKRLRQLVREREDDLAQTKRMVEEALPEFNSLMDEARQEGQNVALFRGESGLRAVIDDLLDTAKPNDYYIIGYTGIARRTLGSYHVRWDERRVRKGIRRKILSSEENRDLLSKAKLTSVRYLPGQYASPASTTVYADRVVIHLMEDKKPLAIMITSRSLAKVYKNYFRLLWEISKP